jgi:hypothetical protein
MISGELEPYRKPLAEMLRALELQASEGQALTWADIETLERMLAAYLRESAKLETQAREAGQ